MGRKKFFIPRACGDLAPHFGPGYPWLAPMAGYSDLPFRLLCREYGAATCVTEMVSARGLVYKSPGTGELLQNVPADQPLVVQLFGDEPEIMGEAARMLLDSGYRWFDCNMGCPARKVLRQNCGAKLLVDPQRAISVAKAMVSAVREYGGGIGFKLRSGMDEKHPMYAELPLRLQDAGASWLALHPRYAAQGYTGAAHWEQIASLAEKLEIPLLASGDLFQASAGMECLAATGANGVMYARGALRNPYIFSQHAALMEGRQAAALSMAKLGQIIKRHIALARDLSPEGAFFKIRAIVPRYVRDLPGVGKLRLALLECADWKSVYNVLDEFMARNAEKGE